MANEKVWRPHAGKPIDKLYAWVAEEADGGEGIAAASLPGLPGVTPLIGADRQRIESYRHLARQISAMPNVKAMRLKMFVSGVEIDRIEP